MAREYIYFAGSLPMLFFGSAMPMSVAQFDENAAHLLDEATAELLRQATLYAPEQEALPENVRKFYDFETALRNSALDFRKKYRPDAADFKRGNPDFYSEITPALTQAAGCADLLEAEKIIDRLRWNAAESLTVGHYADLTMLALYRIRLQILEKYLVRNAENGNQALEKILNTLLNENAAKN